MQPIIFSVSILVMALFYFALFRPWQLRWGTNDDEIKRSMPGDDIVGKPSFNATRTVSIKASAENIYPWIVQMGVGRAGWYSYDLLDNLGRPSAEVILFAHQTIQVGDVVPMSPDGKQGLWEKDFKNNECYGGIKKAIALGSGEYTLKKKTVAAL